MRYVVDDIGEVVEAMDVSTINGVSSVKYIYGHRKSIATRLNTRSEKYPLIALKLDTSEDIVEGIQQFNLNLVIATLTKGQYTEELRMDKIFRPVLYPLYIEFFKQLKNSGLFMWEGLHKYPPHVKTDRHFFGITEQEGNTKYIFNDPLDGIEITNLRINSTTKC
jgi:hypothetical protein